MRKWWHRAKVVFFALPIMLCLLVFDLIGGFAEGLDEFWRDLKDLGPCVRDEWREGWIQEESPRGSARGK